MGCLSSKNTTDENGQNDAKGRNDPKTVDTDEPSRKKRGKRESFGKPKTDRCTTDEDFADAVREALRANSDLMTINDFKDYISSRYQCEADDSFQNEIIHKVIGEQFVKGGLSIKTI